MQLSEDNYLQLLKRFSDVFQIVNIIFTQIKSESF